MTNTSVKYERTQHGNLLGLPRPPVAFVFPEALVNTKRTANICSSSDAIEMNGVWASLLFLYGICPFT